MPTISTHDLKTHWPFRHLVQHLSRRIKKLQARCAIGADFEHDSVTALWVFQDERRRAIGFAPEE
jgi:Arc/MetJ family transcription regulator